MGYKNKQSEAPFISVVIPTYGRQQRALKVIQEFLRLDYDRYEIIVIDQNDSPSEEARKIAEREEKLKYHHVSERGLPKARNLGIIRARGDLVIFFDDDVLITSGILQAYAGAFRDPRVGGVAGRVKEIQPVEIYFPGKPRAIGKVRAFDGNVTGNFDSDQECRVDTAQGCNMGFRRHLLLKMGGFDERYGGTAHLEETDACMRLRRLGYEIVYKPTAEVVHERASEGGCREINWAHWFYWYGHNYMLFFLNNLPRAYLPVFLSVRIAKLALTSCVKMNGGILLMGCKGIIDGFITYRRD